MSQQRRSNASCSIHSVFGNHQSEEDYAKLCQQIQQCSFSRQHSFPSKASHVGILGMEAKVDGKILSVERAVTSDM